VSCKKYVRTYIPLKTDVDIFRRGQISSHFSLSPQLPEDSYRFKKNLPRQLILKAKLLFKLRYS